MRLFIAIHAMDACSIVRFRFDAIVTAEVGAARDVGVPIKPNQARVRPTDPGTRYKLLK